MSDEYVAYLKTEGDVIYLAVLLNDELVPGQDTNLRYFKRKHALRAANKIKHNDVIMRQGTTEKIPL
jgi:hypothetical protein